MNELNQMLQVLGNADYTFFLAIILGILIGMLFGSLPGLSAVMAVSIMVPFTYTMDPVISLVFLASLFIGGIYGGCTTAILLNIPGDSDSAMTALDGYELTKKGQGAQALGHAIIATTFGGLVGSLGLILGSTFLAKVSTYFGPVEYFGLTLLALATVSSFGQNNIVKSFLSVLLGLFLTTIGIDPFNGIPRFSFGVPILTAGFDFVPIMIGLFTMTEILLRIINKEEEHCERFYNQANVDLPHVRDYIKMSPTFFRSSFLGVLIGSLPGIGATVASVVGYSAEKRLSPYKKSFGSGVYEGVVASQAASSAAAVGTFIPLLSLGIPGGAVAAMLLSVFQIHGMQPGPLIFSQRPDLIYSFFVAMLIANMLVLLAGFLDVKMAVKITEIPSSYLITFISVFSVIGAYSTNNRISDVIVMFLFGVLGVLLKRFDFSIIGLVLGLVLGPVLEPALLRALIMYDYNPLLFFTRPVGAIFIVVAILILIYPLLKKLLSSTQTF